MIFNPVSSELWWSQYTGTSGECCSNGHECRIDGASQIQRLIFTTCQNFDIVAADWLFAQCRHSLDFWYLAQKKNLLFGGLVKASKQAQPRWNKMDWIMTKHPIFNSIRSLSQSWQSCAFCHFTWLITCGGCSRKQEHERQAAGAPCWRRLNKYNTH